MPIVALALFGSRARGDAANHSDIDLLLVTQDRRPRHANIDHISLSFYPLQNLKAQARAGDLFLCHVLTEGRPLHDPDGVFPALRASFQLRTSYAEHIRKAADLGWLLARFGHCWAEAPLLRRRIAWAVRTILIARSAEAGNPIFSPAALAALGPSQITAALIASKDADHLSVDALTGLQRFLREEALADPLPTASDPHPYAELFRRTGNEVALGFLRQLLTTESEPVYA